MAPSSNKHALLFLGGLLAAVLSSAAAQAPMPSPSPPPPPAASACNPLRLSVCAGVLDGLLNVSLGLPGAGADDGRCCPLIRGLVDFNVGACFCTAIRLNVLRVRLDLAPLAIRLLLFRCGGSQNAVPAGFTCTPPPA